MTAWFVTRHPGAIDWARDQGIEAQHITHLDPDQIEAGDTVMGTLPINVIADLTARNIRYLHLTLNLPANLRGKELTAQDLTRLDAQLQEYTATRI